MAGFCKFYNENTSEECEAEIIIASVLNKDADYLEAIFYEKLGFYIFLILGTDNELHEEASFPLKSLMGYLHTNNLIILDVRGPNSDSDGDSRHGEAAYRVPVPRLQHLAVQRV